MISRAPVGRDQSQSLSRGNDLNRRLPGGTALRAASTITDLHKQGYTVAIDGVSRSG